MNSISRYQRILRTREQQREVVQKELHARLESEQEIQGFLLELEEERHSALERFGETAGRGISVQELWMSRQMVQVLEGRIECSEKELAQVREDIQETQSRLFECHKEVRVMETYMGKLQDQEKYLQETAEQKALDDFANSAFLRRRSHEAGSF